MGRILYVYPSQYKCVCCRDSSIESGAADTVSLSVSVSELEDPTDTKGKKKRGRPGRPPVRTPFYEVPSLYIVSSCISESVAPPPFRQPIRSLGSPQRRRLQAVLKGGRPMGSLRPTVREETLSPCLRWSEWERVPCSLWLMTGSSRTSRTETSLYWTSLTSSSSVLAAKVLLS